MQKTILITGASGLVGMSLLEYFSNHQNKYKNIIIKAVYHNNLPLYLQTSNRVQWINADLNDDDKLNHIIRGVNEVYQCAGLVSFRKQDTGKLMYANHLLTKKIVDACLKHKISKLLYVSSASFLSSEGGKQITENIQDLPYSRSPYEYSKFLAELEVWRGIKQGLPSVIVNPSLVIGVSKWMGSFNQTLYRFVKRKKIFPAGSYGFVASKDLAKIMAVLMESEIENSRYIISAENITYKDLFYTIKKYVKNKRSVKLRPIKPLEKQLLKIYTALMYFLPLGRTNLSTQLLKLVTEKKEFDNRKLLSVLPKFTYTKIESCLQQALNRKKTI